MDFSRPWNFFDPKHEVEFSNGGMSIDNEWIDKNGNLNVTLSDKADWEPDAGNSYFSLSPRGLPVTLGITKSNLGDENLNKMKYEYSIPKHTIDSIRNVYNDHKYNGTYNKDSYEKFSNLVGDTWNSVVSFFNNYIIDNKS